MNKTEPNNPKEVGKQNYEPKAMTSSKAPKKKRDKDLPWWVELLFVQIGLPDTLLIKILNANKKSKSILKNQKKPFILILFIIISLAYFYPVIKHSKNKLDCESIAKNYIINNKKITNLNKKELKMLSVNFCSGGEEIYEIDNLNN